MGWQTALGTALYSKLTNTAGTALWSTRVYDTQGPLGGSIPYVIFQYSGGGDRNMSPSRILDCEYRIECIGASQADARSGADYIEAALRDQSLSVSGFNEIACTQTDLFNRIDNVDGKQFYRKGAFYRIRQSA